MRSSDNELGLYFEINRFMVLQAALAEVGDDAGDIAGIISAADTNKDGTIDYEVNSELLELATCHLI